MRETSVTRNFQGYFSRTFQDLKQFPGLSRTKVIFQDFPGPGILKKKSRTFHDFPGGVGTLHMGHEALPWVAKTQQKKNFWSFFLKKMHGRT